MTTFKSTSILPLTVRRITQKTIRVNLDALIDGSVDSAYHKFGNYE